MIQEQTYTFLWSLAVGWILATIFDFFRILRRKGNTKTFIVYMQDILFWIIACVIIVISAFITNDGELRGFMFVGYLLGAIFYLITLSKYVLGFANFILNGIENFLGKIAFFLKNKVHTIKKHTKN